MQQFNNATNQKAAHTALQGAINICLWLSTASSAVALSVASYQLVNSILGNFGADYYLPQTVSIVAILAVVKFCHTVDFFGINQSGKLFATELFAFIGARSKAQMFASFGALRTGSMILWGGLFSMFFGLSFFTSWYGSDLVKAFVSPKVDARKYDNITTERNKEATNVTKIQDEKLAKLEADKAAAVAAVGNKQMRQMAAKGDVWAKATLDSERAAAAKSFERQISAIEKQRGTALSKFENRYEAIEKAKIAAANSDIDSTMSQAKAVSMLTKGFGVLPLIIGAIGILILSISEVSEKAVRGKTNRPTANPSGHSRSGKTLGGGGAQNFTQAGW
jgi:hypothetical protein